VATSVLQLAATVRDYVVGSYLPAAEAGKG
jgi:hypothetical protein